MTKFEEVIHNLTNFIVGEQKEEVEVSAKIQVGFTAPKKKRKYTRRKKVNASKKK
tara:strand:- start:412 stop:576 length:165 start_codon:yes stop_codon:yes gene_type:complete